MAELWDAYDRNFNKIDGVTVVRGEPIPKGIYILSCDIIVRHTDGTYLLMKRDPGKIYGGMWELSAGGGVQTGEDPMTGAVREMREETGIVTENIREIKRYVDDEKGILYFFFLAVTDCPKNSITLQEGETVDYKWVDKQTLLSADKNEIIPERRLKLIGEFNI